MSSITEFTVSSEFIRHIATLEPAMPNATTRPRFLVIPKTVGYGLGRMFGLVAQQKNPLLQVVHTLDEALAALRVQSAIFEPLA